MLNTTLPHTPLSQCKFIAYKMSKTHSHRISNIGFADRLMLFPYKPIRSYCLRGGFDIIECGKIDYPSIIKIVSVGLYFFKISKGELDNITLSSENLKNLSNHLSAAKSREVESIHLGDVLELSFSKGHILITARWRDMPAQKLSVDEFGVLVEILNEIGGRRI